MAKPNLFAAAKEKGATASNKPQKEEVQINDPKFHMDLSRLAELNHEIWVRCAGCGEHYDSRETGELCPGCGKEN